MERIEFGCRLARCLLHRLTDEAEQGQLGGLTFLLDVLLAHGRIAAAEEQSWNRSDATGVRGRWLARAVFDPENSAASPRDIGRVDRISTAVRDRLSHDAWRIVRVTARQFSRNDRPRALRRIATGRLDTVLSLLSSFSGQTMDGMTRDKGWRFLDMGRRLERAADLCDLIRHAMVQPGADEVARLPSLLEIANSAMTYRSRYVFGPDPAPVLDLLLADETNPRSVAFQLSALYQHVRSLRGDRIRRTRQRSSGSCSSVFSEMRLIDVDALAVLKRGGRRVRAGGRCSPHHARDGRTQSHALPART